MFVNFNILNQLGSPAINSNTFANRPAAGQTGRLFVSTDTFEIYRDNGTSWDLIGGPGSSTITGTGTATQVAYFTSSQAIGSSANLFWDNTSGFLGVATATPTARIEAVKTDGIGIYANYTTNAGSGSSATAIWAKNVTNSSGFAAVIEETTPNTTAGQYPLLIKHSLSSGTAGVGMGTGIHWQLPDDAGTFKTTQLTIETINAAAVTYATRYRFNVQSNGSSTPVAYINATGLGIFTATPGAALDIHSTGVIAQFNTTSGTGNTYVSFQRTGTGVWRIGDTYNSGANFFGLFNNSISTNAIAVLAATNKTEFTAVENYTTGLARGNYFDYNLNVAAGGSFSSPNAITALGASLDLTLAGNATIPSGARSGLDAYNSIAFTGAGTLTHNQGTQIRAYSNVTAGWAFGGSATGTITHLAGLRALFPDNTGSAIAITNNYALLLNDQTANTGTVTYTNRWGVYQEGASDLNYFAANTLIGSTTNNGYKLQVTGSASVSNSVVINTTTSTEKLDVNGAIRVTGAVSNNTTGAVLSYQGSSQTLLGAWGADAVTRGSIRFYLANSTGTTGFEPMRLNENGLGIGTTNPVCILHTVGAESRFGNVASAFISVYNATSRSGYFQANGGTDFRIASDTDPMSFYVGAVERMRITSAGLVGINNTSPATTLDVTGAISTRFSNFVYSTFDSSTDGNLNLTSNAGQANTAVDTNFKTSVSGGGISTVMTLKSYGNLLIGTTTDYGTYKLQVNGNGRVGTNTGSSFNITTNQAAGTIGSPLFTDLNFLGYADNIQARIRSWDESASTGYGYLTFGTNNSGGVAEKMRITQGGNVLINTTTDNGNKLQVIGSTYIDSTLFVRTQSSGTSVTFRTTGGTNNPGIFITTTEATGKCQAVVSGSTGSLDFGLGAGGGETFTLKGTGQARFVPLAANPSGAQTGDVYYNSTVNKLRLYDGTNWVDLN